MSNNPNLALLRSAAGARRTDGRADGCGTWEKARSHQLAAAGQAQVFSTSTLDLDNDRALPTYLLETGKQTAGRPGATYHTRNYTHTHTHILYIHIDIHTHTQLSLSDLLSMYICTYHYILYTLYTSVLPVTAGGVERGPVTFL